MNSNNTRCKLMHGYHEKHCSYCRYRIEYPLCLDWKSRSMGIDDIVRDLLHKDYITSVLLYNAIGKGIEIPEFGSDRSGFRKIESKNLI